MFGIIHLKLFIVDFNIFNFYNQGKWLETVFISGFQTFSSELSKNLGQTSFLISLWDI